MLAGKGRVMRETGTVGEGGMDYNARCNGKGRGGMLSDRNRLWRVVVLGYR